MAFAPLAVAILAGIVIGLVRGGRISELRRFRINSPLLVLVAIAGGVALDRYDMGIAPLVAVIAIIAGVGFAFRNIHLTGMAVVGVGLLANLLPVVLNGAVPVRADALIEAGIVDTSELSGIVLDGSREFNDDSTILAVLGDTIPVTITDQVMSYGDLILLVGLSDVIANAMRSRKRQRRRNRAATAASIRGAEADSPDQGEAMTNDSPVQPWGVAPSPQPESPFQYSAIPDSIAPATVAERTTSATSDSRATPEFDAANHRR